MAVDWSILTNNQAQPANALYSGYQVGQKLGQDRAKRTALNLFSRDPEAAITALATTDPEAAAELDKINTGTQTRKALTAAQPLIANKDYSGAAQALAGVNPDIAKNLLSMGKDQLDYTRQLGQTAGGIMLNAASIKDPAARASYIAEHRSEIEQGGIPADKIDAFDWNNTDLVRAEATRWLNLSDLAGKVSLEQFGDNKVETTTSPMGVNFGKSYEVPETRADRRANAELGVRQSEYQDRKNQHSPSEVMGGIYYKKANGIPTTPQEDQLYEDYKKASSPFAVIGGGGWGDSGDSGDSNASSQSGGVNGQPDVQTHNVPGSPEMPPVPVRPQPNPVAHTRGTGMVGSQQNPARPTDSASFEAIPVGAYFINPSDGRVLKKVK